MWLIIPILILLVVLVFAWKNAEEKLRIYMIISNIVGLTMIAVMLIVSAMDASEERKDCEKYDITQGTALCSVDYMGEENGYYIINESGLFYSDRLAISVGSAELSEKCKPGDAVKLYREKGDSIVYDDENRVELKDGSSAYFVDNVVVIEYDANMYALGGMILAALFLCINSVVCLGIAIVVRVHKKEQKNKKIFQEIN